MLRFCYILMMWVYTFFVAGCITLQPENPIVERSKRYKPLWTMQSAGIVHGEAQANQVYFLYIKKGQADLLQAVKQAEWEGRGHFFKQGTSAAITMEDLYYEGHLDIDARQKRYAIYILFITYFGVLSKTFLN